MTSVGPAADYGRPAHSIEQQELIRIGNPRQCRSLMSCSTKSRETRAVDKGAYGMSINALLLDGWDEASTWGTDEGRYYAQLTPNGVSDDDGPHVWITPPRYAVHDRADLAREISDATGASTDDVLLAMRRGANPDGRAP